LRVEYLLKISNPVVDGSVPKAFAMRVGATCFLCEVGSRRLIRAHVRRSIRPDGIGTCASCSVHACPQHGDRHAKHFKCADCLAERGAAVEIGEEPSPHDGNEPDPEPGVSLRRLLSANDASVGLRQVDRLERGFRNGGLTFEGQARQEVEELAFDALWAALGIPVPEPHEVGRSDYLVYDSRDPRELVFRRLDALEGEAAAAREQWSRENADWRALALAISVPLVARGAALGTPVLRVPGGLTMLPRVALLAQACANVEVD
jgi:hypothetical protein